MRPSQKYSSARLGVLRPANTLIARRNMGNIPPHASGFSARMPSQPPQSYFSDDLRMKFTILGSGTCVTRKDAGTAGYLVQTKNKNILMDGGSGTLDRLANTQVSYKEIDMMIVSHFHPDHTLTIPALCQSLNFTPQYNRTKPLFLAGPPGFKTFWEQINVVWNCAPRPDTYEIKVFEISGRADFQGLAITTLVYPEGVHYGSCQAIKIEEDGKSLVYTGDMGYWEGIVDFARGCDVLIADCSYPVKDTPGHL